MRGEKLLKILINLEDAARSFADLFEAVVTSYPLTISQIHRKVTKGKKLFFEEIYFNLKEKEKLSKLIYKLKKQGLVYETKQAKIALTQRGRGKLLRLKTKLATKEILNEKADKKEINELMLVIYDIPEFEKAKRNKLRNLLNQYNFTLLQKSVWLKKGKVSEKFINLLKDLDVLDYVHIFKITQQGTIENHLLPTDAIAQVGRRKEDEN